MRAAVLSGAALLVLVAHFVAKTAFATVACAVMYAHGAAGLGDDGSLALLDPKGDLRMRAVAFEAVSEEHVTAVEPLGRSHRLAPKLFPVAAIKSAVLIDHVVWELNSAGMSEVIPWKDYRQASVTYFQGDWYVAMSMMVPPMHLIVYSWKAGDSATLRTVASTPLNEGSSSPVQLRVDEAGRALVLWNNTVYVFEDGEVTRFELPAVGLSDSRYIDGQLLSDGSGTAGWVLFGDGGSRTLHRVVGDVGSGFTTEPQGSPTIYVQSSRLYGVSASQFILGGNSGVAVVPFSAGEWGEPMAATFDPRSEVVSVQGTNVLYATPADGEFGGPRRYTLTLQDLASGAVEQLPDLASYAGKFGACGCNSTSELAHAWLILCVVFIRSLWRRAFRNPR